MKNFHTITTLGLCLGVLLSACSGAGDDVPRECSSHSECEVDQLCFFSLCKESGSILSNVYVQITPKNNSEYLPQQNRTLHDLSAGGYLDLKLQPTLTFSGTIENLGSGSLVARPLEKAR